jgi:hypothetical protein
MNGYIRIILVGVILLLYSMMNEKNNTFLMNANPSQKQYVYIYLIRYFHYLVYLASSFYLIFFLKGTEIDKYLYLLLIFCIVLGWYVFDACWLSFSEILCYDINPVQIETTVHPTFYSIYHTYSDYFMILSGILYLITVSIVLYYAESMSIIFKILYFIIFMALFVDSLVKSRINVKHYDYFQNNQLKILKNLHDKYLE